MIDNVSFGYRFKKVIEFKIKFGFVDQKEQFRYYPALERSDWSAFHFNYLIKYSGGLPCIDLSL